jgi:hypothetical protein
MTILGWVFMLASNLFVWGLTIWCFYQVLTVEEDGVVKPPDSLGG